MKLLLALLLTACACASQTLGPFTVSGNFAADLTGPVDTRPATWGRADAVAWPITFKPPAGYRVRILRLRGDLVAWPRVLDDDAPVRPGKYAGVLLGFQTTAPDASIRCDYCADNTALYIQAACTDQPVRAPFDYAGVTLLLGPDHKLIVKVASWLNTTGYPIHLEPTYTLQFQYERLP